MPKQSNIISKSSIKMVNIESNKYIDTITINNIIALGYVNNKYRA
jgi:hypothetical protein